MRSFFWLIVLCNLLFAQGWQKVNSRTVANITGCSFVSQDAGWAACGDGTVLKTTNGGSDWTVLSTGSTEYLNCIQFLDTQIGYAGGYNGVLLKTTNGGTNWTKVPIPFSTIITNLFFRTPQYGFLTVAGATETGGIFRTMNGGTSWDITGDGLAPWLSGVYFPSDEKGFTCGGSGWIVKTSDMGSSWSVTRVTSQSLTQIKFYSDSTAWVVGTGGTIIKSTDGGNSFSIQNSTTAYDLYCLSVVNATNAWAAGESGTLLRTTDGGQSWKSQSVNFTGRILGIHFTDSKHGWFVGDGGTIYRYLDNSGAVNENTAAATDFQLYQNYPNPFNPVTRISFSLARRGNATLTIYNSLGTKIAEIAHGEYGPGLHNVSWNASGFPSGIYYYRLKTDSYSAVKKLILLK